MVGRCTSYAAGRDLTSGLWKFERSAPSRTCSSLASGLAQNTKPLLIATSWPPPRPGQFFGKQSTWCSVLCIILLSPFCCCSCKTAAQDKDLNEEPNSKVSCCVEVFVICLSHPLILSMPFHFPTGTMHACLPKNRFNATSCDDDCCGGRTAAVWQEEEGRFLLLNCLDACACTNTFTNPFSHLFPLQVQ